MRYLFIYLLSTLCIAPVLAQQTVKDSSQLSTDSIAPAWSFGAEALYYILPDENNTTTFIGYADYKALHLEARYNYEDTKTGAVFGGYRFDGGRKIQWGLTPIVGLVFGNTDGIAPGLETDFSWKKIDFYSETEYVIDFSGEENNFLYTWLELAVTPFNNFRTGISANRTKLYQTSRDIQRAFFIQYSFWKLTAGLHYFNPFTTNEGFGIATLAIEF